MEKVFVMQEIDLKMSEKEKKILDAAIAVIGEKGFSAASTSEIARQAGVAEGTIFRYFKTKKDILRGILIHLGNVIAEPLVVYGLKKILYQEGREDLRSGIRLVLKDRMAVINAVFPMLRIVITEAMYHEDIRQILYDKIISRAVEVFEEYHREMVEKGLMKKEIDAVVAGRSILGNLVLFFVYRNLFGPMIQLDDYDRELDQVIDAVMHGIAMPADRDKP